MLSSYIWANKPGIVFSRTHCVLIKRSLRPLTVDVDLRRGTQISVPSSNAQSPISSANNKQSHSFIRLYYKTRQTKSLKQQPLECPHALCAWRLGNSWVPVHLTPAQTRQKRPKLNSFLAAIPLGIHTPTSRHCATDTLGFTI